MIELVIFDMDGTMLDTEPVSLEATLQAGKQMGVEMSLAVCESLMGKNHETCVKILRQHFGDDYDIDKAFALHREYTKKYYEANGIPLKAGILELLDLLEKLNIKKCVATSTARASAAHKLKKTNILHRFETLTCGDEVKNGKPAPDIFLKAAASCNTAPENCLIIEDTEAGVLGGKAAGIRTILVPCIAPLSKEIHEMAYAVRSDLHKVAEMFCE